MSNIAQEHDTQEQWTRVKGRLRSSVGEDVHSSWFARMDLEGVQQQSVHLSVPTKFLRSWIQAHQETLNGICVAPSGRIIVRQDDHATPGERGPVRLLCRLCSSVAGRRQKAEVAQRFYVLLAFGDVHQTPR